MPIKRALILTVLLSVAFLSSNAHALSCMKPEGDQVLQRLNPELEQFFGRVRIDDIDRENMKKDLPSPIKVSVNIESTYLSSAKQPLSGPLEISVPLLFVTWGPWGQMYDPEREYKIGNSVDVYLKHNDELGWSFAGPGACTTFSDAEWEALKMGKYNNKLEKL